MGAHTTKSGGESSASAENNSADQKISSLDVTREISRQFADAKKQAYNRRAYILEYTDINGETMRLYNAGGGRYERKRRPEYERMFPENAQRVYKAKFKSPDEWGIMQTDRRTGQITVRKKLVRIQWAYILQNQARMHQRTTAEWLEML